MTKPSEPPRLELEAHQTQSESVGKATSDVESKNEVPSKTGPIEEVTEKTSSLKTQENLASPLTIHPNTAAYAQSLLESNNFTTIASEEFWTKALRWASRNRHTDVLHYLLSSHIDPEYINFSTALHLAAQYSLVDIARIVLDRGARVNCKGRHGYTALHLAASVGDAEVVRLLLDRGADGNIRDNYGRTPMNVVRVGSGAQRALAKKYPREPSVPSKSYGR